DGAGGDTLADQRDCGTLSWHDKRQGAPQHFARDNHDLALASLFLGESAIDPLGLPVLRLLAATRVHAIDMNLAGQLRAALHDGAKRLAELVGDHERRSVLAIEVTAELEGAVALG